MEQVCCKGGIPKSQSSKIIIPYDPVTQMPEKWCSRCRRYVSLGTENWHRNANKADGLADYCKPCNNASRKERGYNKPIVLQSNSKLTTTKG